jgi:hypothetical protein
VVSFPPPFTPAERRTQRRLLAIGMALVLPALTVGFIADDYMQIAQLERWSKVPTSPLDLYVFIPRDATAVENLRQDGVLPYFAAPGLKLAFLRPLSSGLMWLDHTLFGRWPLPYHVHTLLWFGGLLLAVAVVLRRTLPAPLALLSLLLFCLDDAHSMGVGWIAARNATVSCALVFAGLAAHIRWRATGWQPGAWLAPLALLLGLAGGEMGLGALCYLLAWELCERRPGRWRALLPSLLVAGIYLTAHRLTGSGARASGGYLDPFGDPLGTLRALPERAALLLGNLLAGSPIDILLMDARLRLPLLAVGAAAALALALWLPRALARLPPDEARAVRFFAVGAAGALLVSVPALVGERVLLAASLGGAVVLATLLRDAWRRVRHRQATALAAAGLLAVALPNLVLAPLLLLGKTALLRKMSTDYQRLAGQAEIAAPVPARVVVVAMNDLLPMQLPVLRVFDQKIPPETLRAFIDHRPGDPLPLAMPLPDRVGYHGTTVLSLSSAQHHLRRTGPDRLELFTPQGTLLDGAWAAAMRARSLPMSRGHVTRLPHLTATVLDDRQGRPTRVQFQFDRPLDDPSLVFLALSQGRLRRLTLPPAGQDVPVPQDPPLF